MEGPGAVGSFRAFVGGVGVPGWSSAGFRQLLGVLGRGVSLFARFPTQHSPKLRPGPKQRAVLAGKSRRVPPGYG